MTDSEAAIVRRLSQRSSLTAIGQRVGPRHPERAKVTDKRSASKISQRHHVVILDNLSAHNSATARHAIEAAGGAELFLPPYSPDDSLDVDKERARPSGTATLGVQQGSFVICRCPRPRPAPIGATLCGVISFLEGLGTADPVLSHEQARNSGVTVPSLPPLHARTCRCGRRRRTRRQPRVRKDRCKR
jgi:hypothetical protein